jgi:hypothetical protein
MDAEPPWTTPHYKSTDCTDPDVLRRRLIHSVTDAKAEEVFEAE